MLIGRRVLADLVPRRPGDGLVPVASLPARCSFVSGVVVVVSERRQGGRRQRGRRRRSRRRHAPTTGRPSRLRAAKSPPMLSGLNFSPFFVGVEDTNRKEKRSTGVCCRRRSCRLSSAVGVLRYVGFSSVVVVVRSWAAPKQFEKGEGWSRQLQEFSSVTWTSPVFGLLRSSTRIPALSGAGRSTRPPISITEQASRRRAAHGFRGDEKQRCHRSAEPNSLGECCCYPHDRSRLEHHTTTTNTPEPPLPELGSREFAAGRQGAHSDV